MESRSGRAAWWCFSASCPLCATEKHFKGTKQRKCSFIASILTLQYERREGKAVSNSIQCVIRSLYPVLFTPSSSSDLHGITEVVFCCLALPFPAPLCSSALCFGPGLQASLRSFPPSFCVLAQSAALVLGFFQHCQCRLCRLLIPLVLIKIKLQYNF